MDSDFERLTVKLVNSAIEQQLYWLAGQLNNGYIGYRFNQVTVQSGNGQTDRTPSSTGALATDIARALLYQLVHCASFP